MNPDQAISYLEESKQRGVRPGLDTIRVLLNSLGNPQQLLKVVHVAGTNGKSSFVALLSSILQAAGYSVGVYSSPWLLEVYESITVNDKPIDPEAFARIMAKIRQCSDLMAENGHTVPTEFELVTALALVYFREQKPDIAIVEVGIGGREDATNVFDSPLVSVLMPIDMDHTRFLGPTIHSISSHAAGIIKTIRPVVIAPQNYEEAQAIIQEVSKNLNAPTYWVNPAEISFSSSSLDEGTVFSFHGTEYRLKLLGDHQAANAATALLCSSLLKTDCNFERITPEAKLTGVAQARLASRFEVLQMHPYFVIVDGAHNQAGAEQLRAALCRYFASPPSYLVVVLAMNRDTDVENYIRALLVDVPYALRIPTYLVVTTSPRSPVPMDPAELAKRTREVLSSHLFSQLANSGIPVTMLQSHPRIDVANDIDSAMKLAKATIEHQEHGLMLITGSLYFAGLARKVFLDSKAS